MAEAFRIYMDDSGNVDEATTNAPERRYGSVTAVILPVSYLEEKFDPLFPQMAQKHFGVDDQGLPCKIHRRVLAGKPPPDGPFAVLADPEKRAAWDRAALNMFNQANYTAITACVDKVEWYWKYPNWRGDFYQVLVEAVLERSFYFLRYRGSAEAFIEWKNGPKNDRVCAAFTKAMKDGFDFISADKLRRVFPTGELGILTKNDRSAGCQLADLLASPAMQHLREINGSRPAIEGGFTRKVIEILSSKKFYREQDRMYGRVWRPRRKTAPEPGAAQETL